MKKYLQKVIPESDLGQSIVIIAAALVVYSLTSGVVRELAGSVISTINNE